MLVMPLGSVTLVSLSQDLNVSLPVLVTPLGIAILAKR